MYRKRPVTIMQSTLSTTPPFVKIYPSCSAFSMRFIAVKKRAPNGATKAMKQVIQKMCTFIDCALNSKVLGPKCHS